MMIVSSGAMAFDFFHCKAATCNEFYYGLMKFPRHKEYVNVCQETVRSLQSISQRHGKCLDEATGKLNPGCIYALATTMKTCVYGLRDVPKKVAGFYCGHRLMQNCARHVGLERFPYDAEYQRPQID